jgi:hypothetical protein
MNLKGGKVYLAKFQRLQSKISWSPCFEPVASQYIMIGICGGGALFTFWQPGSKEREKGARFPISLSRAHLQ